MKTNTKYIKFIRFILILFAVIFLQTLNAENIKTVPQKTNSIKTIFVPNLYFKQNLKYKGCYSADFKYDSPALSFFLKLKTEDILPKIKLKKHGLSLRFSPIFYFENKNLKPALSFLYGGLNNASFMAKYISPNLSVKKTSYSGIKFFPKNFISCTASKNDISKACEFSINNFNIIALAEQKNTSQWANLHLSFAYKNKNIKNGNIKLGFNLYSCFYPSLHSKLNLFLPKYNQIYASEFIFIAKNKNKTYKFLSSISINLPIGDNEDIINAKNDFLKLKIEKNALSGKFEFNYLGKYIDFNTGINFRQKHFFAIKRKKQKEILLSFFQPKLVLGIFELKIIYNFLKNFNNEKNKKYNLHSGGIDFKLRNSNYIITTGFYYKDKNYTVNGNIQIKNLAYWQNIFSANYQCVLQEKRINKFILKKYSSNLSFKINCNKNIQTNFFAGIKQENKITKRKKESEVITWQKLVYNFGTEFEYNKNLKFIRHSIKLKLGIQSKKEKFYFSLSYNLSSQK